VNGYRIIDCDLHDLYEIWILHRRRLLLNWVDEDGIARLELLLPRTSRRSRTESS